MKYQNKMDRMDESLGMRDGKESMKSQSYQSRRDESMGMKDSAMDGKCSKTMNVYDVIKKYNK